MMTLTNTKVRYEAARRANADDASLWRWFCLLFEEGRIRWCRSSQGWLVSVDHRHVATDLDFDAAIRAAKVNALLLSEADKRITRRKRVRIIDAADFC
jgi:hypothetical protein